MSQGTSGNRAANSYVMELGVVGTQATFDVAQALPKDQLGKGHAQILIHAREGLDVPLAFVSLHATSELLVR